MAKDYIFPIPLETFDAATLSGSYQIISTTGLPNACIGVRFVNNSNNVILISWDGATDHDVVLANSTLELPKQTNNVPNNKKALVQQGQLFYVKSASANAGTLYVAGYYV